MKVQFGIFRQPRCGDLSRLRCWATPCMEAPCINRRSARYGGFGSPPNANIRGISEMSYSYMVQQRCVTTFACFDIADLWLQIPVNTLPADQQGRAFLLGWSEAGGRCRLCQCSRSLRILRPLGVRCLCVGSTPHTALLLRM